MKSFIAILLLLVAFAICSVTADHEIRVENNCHFKIWPGVANNPGKSLPLNGGFELDPHHSRSFHVPHGWSGRVWGRTNCNAHGHCETGDCGK